MLGLIVVVIGVYILIKIMDIMSGDINRRSLHRKFYKKRYYEVPGKVVSFKDLSEGMGIHKEVNYVIDVETSDGQLFHVTTKNKKASKYRKKTTVTLLVPRQDDYHIKDEENAVVIKEEAGSVLKIILAIIAACLVYIIYMIIFGHVLFANHPVY
ncbi:MAG: hypothetical protein IKN85_12780 [Oscillospiraceae bacterium]|nr:hypothetical protein [Oscillospiraceae bacterium]MBR3536693.1 hypothetical protein [Oscillospiraceae bacterium]MBR6836298.1 hypothetical protein [Oscillospiraceae bacterium]